MTCLVTFYDLIDVSWELAPKNRIWAQGQGGAEIQSAGILGYVEELNFGSNAEIAFKGIFRLVLFLW